MQMSGRLRGRCRVSKVWHPVQSGNRMTGSSGGIDLSADTVTTCSGVQIADAEVSRIPRSNFHSEARQPRQKRPGLSYRLSPICHSAATDVVMLRVVCCG